MVGASTGCVGKIAGSVPVIVVLNEVGVAVGAGVLLGAGVDEGMADMSAAAVWATEVSTRLGSVVGVACVFVPQAVKMIVSKKKADQS